jgi:GH25 family lysozyme M1 (1,4-beta-N-acetylmuramidase)
MTVMQMVDLSSNNGVPNLKVHFDAGYRMIMLKATEATTYDWAAHNTYTADFHKIGGGVDHYHFGRQGDARAQARFFVSQIRGSFDRKRDVVTIDAETNGVNGVFVRAFIDTVIAELGAVKGLIYGSPAFLNANGIGKYRGWRLHLAEYGPHADVPRSWVTWMAWQWTDRARGIPGMPGAVDCSHIKSWMLPTLLPRPVITWPTLRIGATGSWVHKLQALLNAHGAHLTIDGNFGSATRDAVNRIRRQHGWAATGTAGYRVWKALGA